MAGKDKKHRKDGDKKEPGKDHERDSAGNGRHDDDSGHNDLSETRDLLTAEQRTALRERAAGLTALINTLEDLRRPLPQEILDAAFISGNYPYDKKLDVKRYESRLHPLFIELAKLQNHVRASGERIVVVFEGRDAAGKGGTINTLMTHVNPRHCHVVALTAPSTEEAGQWYFQRYIRHMPTAGHITLFDRSWYNRAGVEKVFGFCTDAQYHQFLEEAPKFERMLTRDGIKLFKYWLTVGREEQLKRLHKRAVDPLKQWKLSDIDIKGLSRWQEYSDARKTMMEATHADDIPWTVIRSNDKKRARINCLRHFLSALEYEGKDAAAIGETDPRVVLAPAW